MVRALLETDIDVDHVNHLGWTALLETVLLGDGDAAHVEILQMLLDAGADRSIADNDGVTALEHARERGLRRDGADTLASVKRIGLAVLVALLGAGTAPRGAP